MALDFGNSRTADSFKRRNMQAVNMKKGSVVMQIAIDNIEESPLNEGMPCENIDELAKSIKENGLIEPVNVYDLKNGKYLLYSGHRRLLACKKAGLKVVSALTKDYPDDAEVRFRDHSAANAQRKKDTRFYLAEIRNARAVIKEKHPGISRKEENEMISEMIGYGMSKSQIYRYEGMRTMCSELLELEPYGLSAHTLYLAKGLTEDQQRNVAAKCREILNASRKVLDEDPENEMEASITRNQFKEFVDLEKGIIHPSSETVSTYEPAVTHEASGVEEGVISAESETAKPDLTEDVTADPSTSSSPENESKPERVRTKVSFREKLSEKEGDLLRLLDSVNPDNEEDKEAAMRTIKHLLSALADYQTILE